MVQKGVEPTLVNFNPLLGFKPKNLGQINDPQNTPNQKPYDKDQSSYETSNQITLIIFLKIF